MSHCGIAFGTLTATDAAGPLPAVAGHPTVWRVDLEHDLALIGGCDIDRPVGLAVDLRRDQPVHPFPALEDEPLLLRHDVHDGGRLEPDFLALVDPVSLEGAHRAGGVDEVLLLVNGADRVRHLHVHGGDRALRVLDHCRGSSRSPSCRTSSDPGRYRQARCPAPAAPGWCPRRTSQCPSDRRFAAHRPAGGARAPT